MNVVNLKEEGLKYVETERATKELIERGVKEKDISVALDLMGIIAAINEAVDLSSSKGLTFNFVVHKNNFGDGAGYHREDNGEEIFSVFVEGLLAQINKEMATISILGINPDGSAIRNTKDWPKPSYEEILISIACHEIRHRIQHSGVVLISPDLIKNGVQSRLKGVVTYVKILFEESRKLYLRRGESQEFIEHKLNIKEFDARVIENMVMISVHEGGNLQQIIDFLKLEG